MYSKNKGIQMLQIAICDDEQFYREKVQSLLKQYFKNINLEYTIHHYLSGEEFLTQCENNVKYDIVFVTAFIDYALEGYKVNAVRYIMKDTLDTAIPEDVTTTDKYARLTVVSGLSILFLFTFYFIMRMLEKEEALQKLQIRSERTLSQMNMYHNMQTQYEQQRRFLSMLFSETCM